jgi:HK97 family phage major capsid protein
MTTAQKIKELKAQIAALTVTAQKYLSDESKDVDKAATALDEAETLEKECALLTRMLDREKEGVQDAPAPVKSSEKAFAQAFRDGFPAQKDMSEGSDADGGYTVPEDIRTSVEQYRDAKFSLRQLVDVENVRTKSGRRTFQKRAQQSAFSKIGEGGKIGRRSTPQFEILEYSVDKYGGYMPVTNELLEDSDANITQIIVNWLGDAAHVTDNALILAQLGTKAVTAMGTIEELKYAVIVTLGQAFAETCAIITNDDGLLWMDTLKDENGRPLLKGSATDVLPPRIAIGTRNIPVHVLPNTDLPTEFEYGASEDTTVKAGKTYYTRTGAGTAQSPYSYTPVETPTGNPKTSGYYEVTASLIPMIPGDLHEGIKLFDRRKLQLKMSDVAVVGAGDDQLNAYEDDLTLIRALERLDVRVKDAAAFVNGRLRIAYA